MVGGLRTDEECDAFRKRADNCIKVLIVVTLLAGEGTAMAWHLPGVQTGGWSVFVGRIAMAPRDA